MDSLADLSDQALLARTREQPDAFGVFYRRHEQAILGYMLRRTKDPDLSADLTAETFAAALQSVGRYRPGPEPASAWLFGIARNVLGSTIRRGRAEDRARRRLGIPALPLDPTVRQGLEALVDDIAVRQLLAEIPHDQSEAIRGRFLEESSYQDLARRTASSQAAVRKRVSRGLRTLRTRLNGET